MRKCEKDIEEMAHLVIEMGELLVETVKKVNQLENEIEEIKKVVKMWEKNTSV